MRIKKLKAGFEELTEEKARIIAHLMGDGCIYICRHNYVVRYEVKDRDLLDSFSDDIKRVYGLKISWAKNPSGKTGELLTAAYLQSKLTYEDLMRYGSYRSANWNIGKELLDSGKDIKREFLRAFFDDEGSVIPYGKKAIVRLYSINLEGLKQIQRMLIEFSLDSSIVAGFGLKRNVFALVIKDIDTFARLIGFNSIRKNMRLMEFINKKV